MTWSSGSGQFARINGLDLGGGLFFEPRSLQGGFALAAVDAGLPGVACPGDVVWTLGATQPIPYALTNAFPSAHTYVYRLTSVRGWPGFPIVGGLSIAGGATDTLTLGVPVPDTARPGSTRSSSSPGSQVTPPSRAPAHTTFTT